MGCFGSKKDDSPSTKPDKGDITPRGADPPKHTPAPASKPDPVPDTKPEKKPEPTPAPAAAANSHGDDKVIREPIDAKYSLGKEIGKGGFSTVIEATNKA